MAQRFGLSYARGPYRVESSVASSAFSHGDLLVKAATSAISRTPINGTSNCVIGNPGLVGIALSSSTASYDNQVPYLVADNDTEFWSRATTGQTFQEGDRVAFQYTSSIFFAVPAGVSLASQVAVCVKGSNVQTWNTDNSEVSYILVRLLPTSSSTLLYDA